jgi:hypothetical protein
MTWENKLSKEMLEYCQMDVELTHRIMAIFEANRKPSPTYLRLVAIGFILIVMGLFIAVIAA